MRDTVETSQGRPQLAPPWTATAADDGGNGGGDGGEVLISSRFPAPQMTVDAAAVRCFITSIWSWLLHVLLHVVHLIFRLSYAAVGLTALLFLALPLYRRYLHPLSRIPGPPLAAISRCWYAYHVRNGHMLRLGKTLHKRYGPVVRVGPNEVWFASKDAFKIIYSELFAMTRLPELYLHRVSAAHTSPGSTNGYEKSDFYRE